MKNLACLLVAFVSVVFASVEFDKNTCGKNPYYIPFDSYEIHSNDFPHSFRREQAKYYRDIKIPIIHFSDDDKAYHYICDRVAADEWSNLNRHKNVAIDEKGREQCRSALEEMRANPANQSFWHRFFIKCDKYSSQAECKRRFDSAKIYFSPLSNACLASSKSYEDFDTCCHFGIEIPTRHCLYRLNKPLHIKGKLILEQNHHQGIAKLRLVPYDKNLEFLDMSYVAFYDMQADKSEALKDTKFIYDNLPKWFHNGLSGEVSFEVEFDFNDGYIHLGTLDDLAKSKEPINITTKKGILGNIVHYEHLYSTVDMTNLAFVKSQNSDVENTLYVKNFKINKKLDDNPLPPQKYKYKFTLNENNSFVNLHKTPAGKVLTKIYTKDKKHFIVADNDYYARSVCGQNEDRREIGIDELDAYLYGIAVKGITIKTYDYFKWWWLWLIDGANYTTATGVEQMGSNQFSDKSEELENTRLSGKSWVAKAH